MAAEMINQINTKLLRYREDRVYSINVCDLNLIVTLNLAWLDFNGNVRDRQNNHTNHDLYKILTVMAF